MSNITEGPPLSVNDIVAQRVDAARLTGADHFMITQEYATYFILLRDRCVLINISYSFVLNLN